MNPAQKLVRNAHTANMNERITLRTKASVFNFAERYLWRPTPNSTTPRSINTFEGIHSSSPLLALSLVNRVSKPKMASIAGRNAMTMPARSKPIYA